MSKTDSTPLTIERLREVLDYCPETGLFTWRVSTSNRMPIGSAAGSLKPNGYVAVNIDGKRYQAHRLALFWVSGIEPKAQAVDHKDRNPSNNKFTNLREATREENMQNASLSKANLSGYKGVSWVPDRQKWQVYITIRNKRLPLGRFYNISDAVAARQKAEVELHPFRVTAQ